jgi:hypothetical protein
VAARALDLICTGIALSVTSLMVMGLADLAFRSYQRGSVSYYVMQTPLWIPQSLLALAAVLLWLALLARALRLFMGEPTEPEGEAAPPVHEGHA